MSDKKRSRRDWPIWVAVVIFLGAIYARAYIWLIQPANGHWGYGATPGTITEIPAEYWFDSGIMPEMIPLFWPAHEIDKRINYRFWHVAYPEVRDIPP